MKKTREVILEQQAINRKLWAKENGRMHHVDANKLIAEFMGIEEAYNPNGNDWVLKTTTPDVNGDTDILDSYKGNELQYHTSWDWLMPVVRRIVSDIELDIDYENEYRDHLMDVVPFARFEDVYKAIVEFIEDYNNGQKCNNCKGITLYPDEQCAVCNRLG